MKFGYKNESNSYLASLERRTRLNPSPDKYNTKFTLVENSKFKKITFGIGERMVPL